MFRGKGFHPLERVVCRSSERDDVSEKFGCIRRPSRRRGSCLLVFGRCRSQVCESEKCRSLLLVSEVSRSLVFKPCRCKSLACLSFPGGSRRRQPGCCRL